MSGRLFLILFILLTGNIVFADENDIDINEGRALVSKCASCHGVRGMRSVESVIPRLAGQQKKYLVKTLKAFRENKRNDAVMSPIAQNLSDDDINKLAAYFSAQREAYCW